MAPPDSPQDASRGFFAPTNPHAWWRYSLVILVLMALFFVGVHYFFPDLAHSGTFGDTFGAINAFFTGIAFAGFLISLALQRKDLELQRLELQDTREIFRFQRNDMLLTTLLEHFNKQFSAIHPTEETLRTIRWYRQAPNPNPDKTLHWSQVERHLEGYHKEYKTACNSKNIGDISLLLNGNYNEVARKVAIQLGIWDSLSFIFDFVNKNYTQAKDKEFYTRLVNNAVPKEASLIWRIANEPLPPTLLPKIVKADPLCLDFSYAEPTTYKGLVLELEDGWAFSLSETHVWAGKNHQGIYVETNLSAEPSTNPNEGIWIYWPHSTISQIYRENNLRGLARSLTLEINTNVRISATSGQENYYNLFWSGKIEVNKLPAGLNGRIILDYPEGYGDDWIFKSQS